MRQSGTAGRGRHEVWACRRGGLWGCRHGEEEGLCENQ